MTSLNLHPHSYITAGQPTATPTMLPTTRKPTFSPTTTPTASPTSIPTASPTASPATGQPMLTGQQTAHPTDFPTIPTAISMVPTGPSGNISSLAAVRSDPSVLTAGGISGVVIGSVIFTCMVTMLIYCFIVPKCCVAGPNDPSRLGSPDEPEDRDSDGLDQSNHMSVDESILPVTL